MRLVMPEACIKAGSNLLRLVMVSSVAISLGGCFHAGPYPGSANVGAPQHMAHIPVPPSRAVEMEDDGLPAQSPPLRRATREQDDPREPWSPNYGKQPGETAPRGEPHPKPTPAPYIAPAPREPMRRADAEPVGAARPAPTRVRFDADAIIARAIAMHEVYNQ